MNKFIKTFLMLVSLLLITTSIGWADNKESQEVYLIGDENGLSFNDNQEYFFEINGMTPGDSESKSIIIKNKNSDSYKLYMTMKEIEEDSDDYNILNKITLNIKLNGQDLYNGFVSGNNEKIEIGEIKPNEDYIFDATVQLDGRSTGNEYADKNGKVEWTFIAENLGGGEDNSINNNNSAGIDTSKPPKTGENGLGSYILLGITGLLVLLIILFRRYKLNH